MREFIHRNSSQNIGNPDPKLLAYVGQCRKMRMSDQEIRGRLSKFGRRAEEIDRVLEGRTKAEDKSPEDKISKFVFKKEDKPQISFTDHSSHEKTLNKGNTKLFPVKAVSMAILILLFCSGAAVAGYYLLGRKSDPSDKNISQDKIPAAKCAFDAFQKPSNSGSAVARVDSTMKLLIEAFAAKDYCLALSLYAENSRDQYEELVWKIISDDIKRNRFLIDLDGYMIPAIDENDPSHEARATISSVESGGSVSYTIKFIKTETGEYLISKI